MHTSYYQIRIKADTLKKSPPGQHIQNPWYTLALNGVGRPRIRAAYSLKEVSACLIWLGCTLGHQNVCHKLFSAIFDLLLDVTFFDLQLIYIYKCRESTCYHAISF